MIYRTPANIISTKQLDRFSLFKKILFAIFWYIIPKHKWEVVDVQPKLAYEKQEKSFNVDLIFLERKTRFFGLKTKKTVIKAPIKSDPSTFGFWNFDGSYCDYGFEGQIKKSLILYQNRKIFLNLCESKNINLDR